MPFSLIAKRFSKKVGVEECKFEEVFFFFSTHKENQTKHRNSNILVGHFYEIILALRSMKKNQDRSSLGDLKFTDDVKTSTADFQSLISSRETACTPGPFAPGSQPRGSSEPPGRFQGRRAAVR